MKNFINHAGSLTSLKTFCGKDWVLGMGLVDHAFIYAHEAEIDCPECLRIIKENKEKTQHSISTR